MGYTNMILATGEAEFAARLADAGATGAIVPDLPLGEGEGIREAFAGAGLALAAFYGVLDDDCFSLTVYSTHRWLLS